MEPLIITCPIVGAELTRKEFPNLPLTPEELAQSAQEAVEAGASIIHLHVRDKDGNPSQDSAIFAEAKKKIEERCECIIQFSTGGAVGTPIAERLAPLDLRPEMATLSLGTMNFGNDIFENSEETILALAGKMEEEGIMPEWEIFDYGMLDSGLRYHKKGLLPEKYHVDFVLGVPGGSSGELENLLNMVRRLPTGQTWTVAGVGRFQLPLATHAIAMGGHVRVGLEDNIYYTKGVLAESNAQLVKRIVDVAKLLNRDVASVQETRRILNL